MSDRSADVLIVGTGPAGAECALGLRAEGFTGSILLVGREPDPPYARPPVTKEYLRGGLSREDVLTREPSAWDADGIELLTRVSAMRLDTAARTAKLSNRVEVEFGKALIATGANVNRLRVDGSALDGIHYLRTLANADALRADVEGREEIVLVGGSFIACEVAASLTALGKRCTLVMPEAAPLSNALGRQAGDFFAEQLRLRGIEIVTGEGLARMEGDPAPEGERARVTRVFTESGRELRADAVVVGVGANPDVMLARAAGLELGESGGLKCSSGLQTSSTGIWAAGDVCEYESVLHGRRIRIEHWEAARSQGRYVARAMLGAEGAFDEVPYVWSDLGDSLKLEYVGAAAGWDTEIVRRDGEASEFTIFYVADDHLVAAMTVGRTEDLDIARTLMRERRPLGGRASLLADPGSELQA